MGFKPNNTGTLAMTANATSQNIALPNGGGSLLNVVCTGNIAHVETGSDANMPALVPSQTAGGGFPVLPNQPPLTMRLKAGDTRIACVSTGNSTVYFTRGDDI